MQARVNWKPPAIFPFSALVGQEQMKRALLANVINPRIGGVLIRGEKGTAKSTAVRALATLLPEIDVVRDCLLQCHPRGELCRLCRERSAGGRELPTARRRARVVNLPLGATEDRVTGTLNLEEAIQHGRRALEPGLLAAAHRGILYIDEVNLLSDHLVDIILDAAAQEINTVEREGISFSHPASFILVGTMNPEEGELRPQLLDRFGLCVEVKAPRELEPRLRVMKQKEYFDQAPSLFLRSHQEGEQKLAADILQARQRLAEIELTPDMLALCSRLALEACVAGHRADLVLRHTARALAALDGRLEVLERDVQEAAQLALVHRQRPAPPPPPPQPEQEPDQQEPSEEPDSAPPQEPNESEQDASQDASQDDSREAGSSEDSGNNAPPSNSEAPNQNTSSASAKEQVFPLGEPFPVKPLALRRDRLPRKGSGRRTRSRSLHKTGRYVKSRLEEKPDDLALDATLRAAAPYQRRRSHPTLAVVIRRPDLRQRVREKRIGNLIVFVVDASGSMGAGRRMSEAKGAVLSLLMDAYQKRDRVALVAFRQNEAQVLLPPTNSIELAYKYLEEMPTGGKTPLGQGLEQGYQLLDTQLRRDPHTFPVLLLISDGRTNVSLRGGKPLAEARELAQGIRSDQRIRSVVIDVERPGPLSLGLARELAGLLGAHYYLIDELKASTLVEALKDSVLLT